MDIGAVWSVKNARHRGGIEWKGRENKGKEWSSREH